MQLSFVDENMYYDLQNYVCKIICLVFQMGEILLLDKEKEAGIREAWKNR